MNKIALALVAAVISTAAFASETTHNGQLVASQAAQASMQDNAFGASQGTFIGTNGALTIGADRGANSGK